MRCEEARLALEAEPSTDATELTAHLHACVPCAAYATELQDLDRRLLDALRIEVPAGSLPAGGPYMAAAGEPASVPAGEPAVRVPPRPAAARARWLGLAAGLGAIAVLAGTLWGAYPRTSLASAVVAHMAHEPDAWRRAEALPRDVVTRFLARRDVRIDPGFPDVLYAQSCWFRGRMVPHLVVRTDSGPVTVMLLPHLETATPAEFEEAGYRGVLEPGERGSIAILAQGHAEVATAAARVRAAVHYLR